MTMNDWKKVKLETFITFKNGKKRPNEKGEIPVYGGNGILDYTNIYNYNNVIIVGRVGAYCGSIYYKDNYCWVSDNAISAKNKDNSNILFDYYLLKSLNLNKRNIGTSQPLLTQEILNSIEISLPPLETQKKIASILSCLDDKIEINNKINANLENQAQTIFKHYFVDNKEKENWKKGKLNDIIEGTLSGDWGKETLEGNYIKEVYCIRGADIPEIKIGNKGKMPTRFILEKNYNSKKLECDSIVIEISGGSPTQSTGRTCLITKHLLKRYDKDIICTNFCRAIKPKNDYTAFIYYYLQHLYDGNVMFSYENGTTGIKNLDVNGLLEIEQISIPPKDLLLKFNNVINIISEKVFNNGSENEILSQIRDTLLPKLMNGEIKI
jgi:type I restriction enzyme S subunit